MRNYGKRIVGIIIAMILFIVLFFPLALLAELVSRN